MGSKHFKNENPKHVRLQTFCELRDRLISVKKSMAIIEAHLEELLQLSEVTDPSDFKGDIRHA